MGEAAAQSEGIIFLHGIGRTKNSMNFLETHFKKQGYKTLKITYPSRKKGISELAVWLRNNPEFQKFQKSFSGKYHFVTHSMGGLVTREYLSKYKADIKKDGRIGRVVAIAPPFHGSEIADKYHKLALYKKFYGPAGEELTTDYQKSKTYDIYYDLGVIAGKSSLLYPDSFLIKTQNDGRVSVNSTKIDGMKDHKAFPAGHTFIINRTDVATSAIKFIQTGKFGK